MLFGKLSNGDICHFHCVLVLFFGQFNFQIIVILILSPVPIQTCIVRIVSILYIADI